MATKSKVKKRISQTLMLWISRICEKEF